MKKKIICLIATLFLLTGCDVEYNLKIDDEFFNEDINIIVPKTSEWEQVIDRMSKIKQTAYIKPATKEKKFYNLQVKSNNNKYDLDYNYKYNQKTIPFSNAINQCYNIINLNTSEGYYDISTSEKVNCLYKDKSQVVTSLTINIITSLKVVSNNADIVDGNIYSWKINKDNYLNKPIEIKIKKPAITTKNNSNVFNIIAIVAIIGCILLLTIYLIIKHKHKKENTI